MKTIDRDFLDSITGGGFWDNYVKGAERGDAYSRQRGVDLNSPQARTSRRVHGLTEAIPWLRNQAARDRGER